MAVIQLPSGALRERDCHPKKGDSHEHTQMESNFRRGDLPDLDARAVHWECQRQPDVMGRVPARTVVLPAGSGSSRLL